MVAMGDLPRLSHHEPDLFRREDVRLAPDHGRAEQSRGGHLGPGIEGGEIAREVAHRLIAHGLVTKSVVADGGGPLQRERGGERLAWRPSIRKG